jgi:hypothetical protein
MCARRSSKLRTPFRGIPRWAIAVAMLGWALTTGGPAICHAADDSAKAGKLFDEATRAYARKEYERAARAFMAAHELMPHGATAYNAAKAWEAAGDKPRGAETFAIALRMGG